MDGIVYTGMGNSTNKKDAQTNAARDFCNYLVRQGEMTAEEVPAMGQTQVIYLHAHRSIKTLLVGNCLQGKEER